MILLKHESRCVMVSGFHVLRSSDLTQLKTSVLNIDSTVPVEIGRRCGFPGQNVFAHNCGENRYDVEQVDPVIPVYVAL